LLSGALGYLLPSPAVKNKKTKSLPLTGLDEGDNNNNNNNNINNNDNNRDNERDVAVLSHSP
jgi:hypothetical protein